MGSVIRVCPEDIPKIPTKNSVFSMGDQHGVLFTSLPYEQLSAVDLCTQATFSVASMSVVGGLG